MGVALSLYAMNANETHRDNRNPEGTVRIEDISPETLLQNQYPSRGWPEFLTLNELKTLGKRKLGKKYNGTYTVKYRGGGVQVEVRNVIDGMHGKRIGLKVAYRVADSKN